MTAWWACAFGEQVRALTEGVAAKVRDPQSPADAGSGDGEGQPSPSVSVPTSQSIRQRALMADGQEETR